ncbi:hypothetical protein A2U01_0117389, partial [Trifolium medium]|nr:hypothetical protein [Trifolium medium]
LITVTTPKKKRAEQPAPAVNAVGSLNPVDLDARQTKKEREEEK